MKNKGQHNPKPQQATPAPKLNTQVQHPQEKQDSDRAGFTQEQFFVLQLYKASCLFRQAYKGLLVGLLQGAEWHTPDELEARGWDLVDTGFTITPPGDESPFRIKIQHPFPKDGSDLGLCYLRPLAGKGMLVPLRGSIDTPDSIYYVEELEGIAHNKFQGFQSTSDTPATVEDEKLNPFLQFCRARLISYTTLCEMGLVSVGWSTRHAFGTEAYCISELVELYTGHPVPLCLLQRVQDGIGVLLNCDYESAACQYRSAVPNTGQGADLFQSDWVDSVFKKSKRHQK